MRITELKVLDLDKPLGIGDRPYFSWIIESELPDTIQDSYRITVSDKNKVVWDSGNVFSRKQAFIEYAGMKLESSTEYAVNITVQDNKGNISSDETFFETGLLCEEDWKAKWIQSAFLRSEYKWTVYGNQPPPVMFKRNFNLHGKVRKARLYSTAYGIYRLFVNKKRPDDREFAPEHTVYREILYYQTYDISSLLIEGSNEISMYVGDGWYHCPQTRPITEDFHELPSVLYQIKIEYENGEIETVVSDGTERCCLGNVLFSDIFLGEKQDANATFEDTKPVNKTDYGYKNLKPQEMQPVRPVSLLPAIKVYNSPKGETIVDFGQIICGRARISIDEPKDRKIILEYFEVPDKEGNYFNSMYAYQKDIYVSDGNPCEYEALFTFHGFRYIKVTGIQSVKKEDFTAVVLSTEKDNAGYFDCSDERINRLYKNIRWSQTTNMLSIPTDCPTREKGGFTGDMQIYVNTAIINENVTPFLTSWLKNLSADQMKNGVVPMTVPFTRLYERLAYRVAADFGDNKPTGIAGWSDAAVIVPYRMYLLTGNELILKTHFNTMEKWCGYVIRTAEEKRGNNGLPYEIDRYLWNTGFHFGEWLIPSQKEAGGNFDICRQSAAYIAPIFGYISVKYMSEICEALGKEEVTYYADIADKMKKAIQEGVMKGGEMPAKLMGAYVLAIAFDLVPDEYANKFADILISMIEENKNRLDTGFLATPYLLDSLVKIGLEDMAYKIFRQDKQPSWFYEVDKGATTIWETWNAIHPDGTPIKTSYNHYAFGCVDEWIFKNIAGIERIEPGFKHFRICPSMESGLKWVKRRFKCTAGWIEVFRDDMKLEVIIPPNTTATVEWKKEIRNVGSGKHIFL